MARHATIPVVIVMAAVIKTVFVYLGVKADSMKTCVIRHEPIAMVVVARMESAYLGVLVDTMVPIVSTHAFTVQASHVI
jgi:hypothetical protein